MIYFVCRNNNHSVMHWFTFSEVLQWWPNRDFVSTKFGITHVKLVPLLSKPNSKKTKDGFKHTSSWSPCLDIHAIQPHESVLECSQSLKLWQRFMDLKLLPGNSIDHIGKNKIQMGPKFHITRISSQENSMPWLKIKTILPEKRYTSHHLLIPA